MNERVARLTMIAFIAVVLAEMVSPAARARMIRYRRLLSVAEQQCLAQILHTGDWRFSPDFHKEMIGAAVVARADLNGDGRKEYMYVIPKSGYCGTAGCSMLIGEAGDDGMCHEIYSGTGSEGAINILAKRDHGYRRLYTPCEVRFDGTRYDQVCEECPNADVHR